MTCKRNYSSLMPSLLVVATLILSACQDSAQVAPVRMAPLGAGPVATDVFFKGASLSEEQQALVQSPPQMDFYARSVLAMQISQLSHSSEKYWGGLFYTKRWLVGPVAKFEDIEAKVSGDENSIVRQSQYEILVDEERFNKLTPEQQEDLVLEETLKAVYSMKNLSDKDLCASVRELFQKETCNLERPRTHDEQAETGSVQALDADDVQNIIPPHGGPAVRAMTEVKALTQEDLARIKKVKAYIQQEKFTLDVAALGSVLTAHDFDQRLIGEFVALDDDLKSTLQQTPAQVIDTLYKQAAALSSGQMQCVGLKTSSTKNCEVEIKVLSQDNGIDPKRNYLQVKVSAEGEGTLYLDSLIQGVQQISLKGLATSERDAVSFLVWPLAGSQIQDVAVGKKYANAAAVLMAENKNGLITYRLKGLLLVPGMIDNITTDKETDKVTCHGAIVAATGLKDDALWVGTDKSLVPGLLYNATALLDRSTPPCPK